MGLYGRSLAKRAIQLSPQEPGAGAIVDFVRCSYLGLDNHHSIFRGAVDALTDYGSLHWSCARTRTGFDLLRSMDAELSQPFTARVVAFSFVILAYLRALHLLASGPLPESSNSDVALHRLFPAPLAHTTPLG